MAPAPNDGKDPVEARAPRRLRRRSDFLAAARGRRFHTDRLTAQGRVRAPDEQRDGAPAQGLFVGFTITKRVGHATERNRIRRRLRDATLLAAARLEARPADVVVVARRTCLEAPFETLVDDLCRAVSVVTKPRARSASGDGDRAQGGPSGAHGSEAAHVRGRKRAKSPRNERDAPVTRAPHGTSDG